MLAVAGSRSLLIVPVVILAASSPGILLAFSVSLVTLVALSSGIWAAFSVSLVIFSALRSGIRAGSNWSDVT